MKRIVSMLSAFLAASAVSLTAFAERLPQPYGQNKEFWCWAAAAKMVAEHNNGLGYSTEPQQLTYEDGLHSHGGVNYWGEDTNKKKTADGAQRSIVMAVKGNDSNQIGTLTNMKDALQYAAAYNVDVGVVGEIGTKLSDGKINWLKNEMKCREYVMAGFYDSGYLHGHVDVITDYRDSDDSYEIFDPWNLEHKYDPANDIFNGYNFKTAGHLERMEYFVYSHNTD